VASTQSLHIRKILHMHEGYGTHTKGLVRIWMCFFDILKNTRYQNQQLVFIQSYDIICFSIIFISFVVVMKCVAKNWRNTQACFECWIKKGMHEHPPIDTWSLPTLVKCLPWMGEVEHPWWIWRCANTSPKIDWKICFWLFGEPQGKTIREAG
jgi:hypothetical protein